MGVSGVSAGQRNHLVEAFRQTATGRRANGEAVYGEPVAVCSFWASVHERVNPQYVDGVHVANETLTTIRGLLVDMRDVAAGMLVRWGEKSATVDAFTDMIHDGNARELQCRTTSYPNGGNPIGGC